MSDEFRDKIISRRALLKTIGRAAIAACVSGSGLFAFAKKRIAVRGEQPCGDRALCEACPRLEDCVFPRALSGRLAPAGRSSARSSDARFSSALSSGAASRGGDMPPRVPTTEGTRP